MCDGAAIVKGNGFFSVEWDRRRKTTDESKSNAYSEPSSREDVKKEPSYDGKFKFQW